MPRARHHAAYPSRPLLRPGVHVCRREDGRLQVGLDTRLAVTAPDTAEIRGLLEGLRHGIPPPPMGDLTTAGARFCASLLDRDLVLDGDALLPALGDAETPEARESVAALFVDAGTDPCLRERRSRSVVAVDHQRLPRAAGHCRQLLTTAGVGTREDPTGPADVVVHLASGESDRARSDGWVSRDVPHLLVQCAEGILRVGPFVVPGETACLRCIDAHHTDRDPRRPLIVEQYAAAAGPRDGLPEPIHHDLLDLAVIWAARDAVRWLDGHRPRTWSTTIAVDPALQLLPTPWKPHPGCGCTWANQVSRSG